MLYAWHLMINVSTKYTKVGTLESYLRCSGWCPSFVIFFNFKGQLSYFFIPFFFFFFLISIIFYSLYFCTSTFSNLLMQHVLMLVDVAERKIRYIIKTVVTLLYIKLSLVISFQSMFCCVLI